MGILKKIAIPVVVGVVSLITGLAVGYASGARRQQEIADEVLKTAATG